MPADVLQNKSLEEAARKLEASKTSLREIAEEMERILDHFEKRRKKQFLNDIEQLPPTK